jgi:hypothetical protein
MHVQGRIASSGSACAHLRIDFSLEVAASPVKPGTTDPERKPRAGLALGSLSTDDRGVYDGAVVIPRDFAIGEYDLVVLTPGDAHCAPAVAR